MLERTSHRIAPVFTRLCELGEHYGWKNDDAVVLIYPGKGLAISRFFESIYIKEEQGGIRGLVAHLG